MHQTRSTPIPNRRRPPAALRADSRALLSPLCRTTLTAWLVAMVVVAPVAASVVMPMSMQELVREATLVIDGQVIAVHSTIDRGRVERVVTLRVGSHWKGTSEEVVHVRLAGGTHGHIRTVVPGVPDMAPGERLVLFLDRGAEGTYHVLGLHQGAWRVRRAGPDGRALVAPVPGADAHGAVVRGALTRRPVPVDDLRRIVVDLAESAR